MVHQIFDPNSVSLDDFVLGGPEDQLQQIGYGDKFNYFHGIPPYQRGYGGRQRGGGVGDVLRFLWRAILPKIKTAGTLLGREALATGSRVLDTLDKSAAGETAATQKSEIIKEIKRGVDNVLEKGGVARQFGTGRSRKSIKRNTIIGKTVPKTKIKKRKRSDLFGRLF